MYFRKFLERGRHMEVCFQEFFIFIFNLLFMHHLILDLESIQHDYLRSLKSQSYKQMPSWPKNECWTWNQRSRGSILTWGNILCWIFLFSRSKTPNANNANFWSFAKPLLSILLRENFFTLPPRHFLSQSSSRVKKCGDEIGEFVLAAGTNTCSHDDEPLIS